MSTLTNLTAQVTALAAKIAEQEQTLAATNRGIDELWHLVAGRLVFFMQAGFAMLEAGSVQDKNIQNILFKNLMDACIAAVCFWLLGYGLAYGDTAGNFLGTTQFALVDDSFTATEGSKLEGLNFHTWFFQWAFAATAATIVSGSVAERCSLPAYFIYSAVITTFIYPVVVHWGWGDGFLSPFGSQQDKFMFYGEKSNNLIDFAGSGIVHMVGGFSGLMGAYFLGPRKGRFDSNGSVVEKPGHNTLLAVLGVLILWVGWYGFNAGSTLCISGGCSKLASKIAVTTTIAPAAACLTAVVYQKVVKKTWDLSIAGNAVLAGLVSITANCAVVEPVGAFFIGMIGAFIYIGSKNLLIKLKVDDPLDAAPVHGFCGAWGLLASGIFATDAGAAMAGYVGSAGGNTPVSSGEQFGVQFVGMLIILLWTLSTSGMMFFALSKFGILRVDEKVEVDGLDITEHGGLAYRFSPNSIINATGIVEGSLEKAMERAIEVSEIKTNEFKSNESKANEEVVPTTV